MIPTALLLPILVLLSSVSATINLASYKGVTTSSVLPNRYVVEFSSSTALNSLGKRSDVDIRAHLDSLLSSRGISYTVASTFNSPIFVGASVTVSNSSAIVTVAALPGVVNVFPVHSVPRPTIFQSDYDFDTPFTASSSTKRDAYVAVEAEKDRIRRAVAQGKAQRRTGADRQHERKDWLSDLLDQLQGGKKSSTTKTTSTSTSKTSTSTSTTSTSTTSTTTSGAASTTSKTSGTITSTTGSTSSTASTSAKTSTTSAPSTPLVTGVIRGSSPNPMAGVDKLQAAGYYGAGIKIGVIDSGVDYTNPALGGCLGAGCKIAGGHDYVGNGFNGDPSTISASNDPLDQCYGHGTFVAGVIGANTPNTYNVTGVAPQASQYHYRVYSCSGASEDSIIAQAMMDAYAAGMDVINLSLGELDAWSESMLAVVASRIAATGVVVAAAAGNDGQNGAFYTESPATGNGVWGIGCADNAVYASQLGFVSGYGDITYLIYRNFAAGTYPLTALTTTYGVTNDACSAISSSLAGSVVVIQIGSGCSYTTQISNLAAAGASMVLAINAPGTAYVYGGRNALSYAQVSPADGKILLGLIASGKAPTITFAFRPTTVPNNDTGNQTSYFSAIGPTNDLLMKPQFNAPGGLVISTLPTVFGTGGFAQGSGTSYSCPFAAGVAALQFGAAGGRGKTNAAALLNAIESTTNPSVVSSSDGNLQSVSTQGSGLVYAYDAINTKTIVSPTELLLNDTANFNGIQTVTVKNTGSSLVTYTLSHSPAETVYTYQAGSYESAYGPDLPPASGQATVIIVPSILVLFPGQSAQVFVTVIPPFGLSTARLPIYSGFVNIKGGSTGLQIPYMGVYGSMSNLPVLDSTSASGQKMPQVMNAASQTQTAPTTYTLVNGDAPTVLFRLLTGSPIVLIDLVSSTAVLNFSPTITKRFNIFGLLGLTWLFPGYPGVKSTSFGKVPIIGNLFEADYANRNSGNNPSYQDGNEVNSYAFAGAFTNGTKVPNGSYKFLIRAQRIATDPTNENNYDSWVSPVFTLAA